jgi:hypothetical protein
VAKVHWSTLLDTGNVSASWAPNGPSWAGAAHPRVGAHLPQVRRRSPLPRRTARSRSGAASRRRWRRWRLGLRAGLRWPGRHRALEPHDSPAEHGSKAGSQRRQRGEQRVGARKRGGVGTKRATPQSRALGVRSSPPTRARTCNRNARHEGRLAETLGAASTPRIVTRRRRTMSRTGSGVEQPRPWRWGGHGRGQGVNSFPAQNQRGSKAGS